MKSPEFIESLKGTVTELSKAESDRFAEFINVVAKDCSTDSMQKAFSRVNIKRITGNNFDLKSYIHCFRRVGRVIFEDMYIKDEHSNYLCTIWNM